MPTKGNKISFCTVCMNRLYHLMQTLPANINANENYNNLEFVLLDYNSTDGLESYIKNNFQSHIENGKLKYYKTLTPKYFHRSHSRNLAFKLASGDLICNVDADNFTGNNFANYINDVFKDSSDIFLTALGIQSNNYIKDVLGRVCVKKEDFININGYDERMIYYGFEDYDFANRLELNGVNRLVFDNAENLKAIEHGQKDRISNEFVSQNLKAIMLNYLTPASTDFLFLFKNGEFKKGTILENKGFEPHGPVSPLKQTQLTYKFSIHDIDWVTGTWEKRPDLLCLYQDGKSNISLNFDSKNNCYVSLKKPFCSFYEIEDKRLLQEAIMLFSQLSNRLIMDRNKLEKQIKVNKNDFGNDVVYKNFDYKNPIVIS